MYILYENISKAILKIPDDLDELLQSLLKGLLEREVSQRFSIADAKNHHWIRRTYPKFGDEVKVKLTKHTSVLPYIKNLHNQQFRNVDYDDDDDDEDDDREIIINESPDTRLRSEFWRYTKLNENDQNIRQSISTESNEGHNFIRADLSQSKRSIYNIRDKCNQS